MSPGKIIAILIWMLAGVFWLYGLISALRFPVLPPSSAPLEMSPILIVPFIFFVAVRVLAPPPSPNTTAKSALLTDIDRILNAQVLFGMLCIMFGVLPLIQALRAGKLLDSYVSYGFFFSAGLGILVGEMIRARRAVPRPWGTPGDEEDRGLLGSIRRLRATNLTAFLTGMWTALGLVGTEALVSWLEFDKSIGAGVLRLTGLFVFFLIPVFIFVGGIQSRDSRPPAFSVAGLKWRLKWQGMVGVRGLCWFIGTMTTGFSLAALATLSRLFVQ